MDIAKVFDVTTEELFWLYTQVRKVNSVSRQSVQPVYDQFLFLKTTNYTKRALSDLRSVNQTVLFLYRIIQAFKKFLICHNSFPVTLFLTFQHCGSRAISSFATAGHPRHHGSSSQSAHFLNWRNSRYSSIWWYRRSEMELSNTFPTLESPTRLQACASQFIRLSVLIQYNDETFGVKKVSSFNSSFIVWEYRNFSLFRA